MTRSFFLLFALYLFLTGCASLPENNKQVESFAFTDTQDTALGIYAQKHKDRAESNEDGFILLKSGLDSFVARTALVDKAERSLDVQYYMYKRGLIGQLFTAGIWRAAERGVRVRMLIDDIHMKGLDTMAIAFDHHPNIEIRLFNPFGRNVGRSIQYVTGFRTLTRRMHNKSLTADNVATIVGGRNIADEYYDANPAFEFADLDALAVGKVVKEVSNAFDEYWNHSLAYPATTIIEERPSEEEMREIVEGVLTLSEDQKNSGYLEALHNSKLAQQLRDNTVKFYWSDAVLLVDSPEKLISSRKAEELHLLTQLIPYFEGLEKELIIISPYFIPGARGMKFLRKLTARGIRIKVFTNSLAANDILVTHSGYSVYREDLLRIGVELYEMDKKPPLSQHEESEGMNTPLKSRLHTKAFVLDRKKVFIGTLNFDPRSFFENSEMGLMMDSTEIAERIANIYINDMAKRSFRVELVNNEWDEGYLLWHGYKDDKPVTFDIDPYSSFWRRLGAGFLTLLPIESQL